MKLIDTMHFYDLKHDNQAQNRVHSSNVAMHTGEFQKGCVITYISYASSLINDGVMVYADFDRTINYLAFLTIIR